MKIINPSNGQVIEEIPEETPENIQRHFKFATVAQADWQAVSMKRKIETLLRFKELLALERDSLATILTSEMGKPITQSRNELKAVLSRIDFFVENTARVMAPQSTMNQETPRLEEKITFEPLGVIGNISAWNYPYFVGANIFVPALLTGNCVLYKPSEFATRTGIKIAELLYQAGIPKEVFALLIGTGAVGAGIARMPLDGIFFTGSYATGVKIAQSVSTEMMRVQLELGGKDPVYVCEDVPIGSAASSLADGAFYNTGQSCCAVERIYVHEKIYSKFVEAFVALVGVFVMGDPMEEKTYIGPLARAEQTLTLEDQVRDAVGKGAKLLCGGKKVAGPGNFFEPTVFIDVHHGMNLMKDESFGPIIGIQKVSDDKEAIKLMNDSEYGLTAGIYTQDFGRMNHVLSQVRAGSVYWNCCDRVSPKLPWSGRGHSGVGCTLSSLGIQSFLHPKAWHLRQNL